MSTQHRQFQRGQAMTEFVVAMFAMIPILLGCIYIFKYADIKHQTIQASRYAALQRAIDPNDGAVADETVARFFRDDKQHGIGLNDKASGTTAGDANPNWQQSDGTSLLGSNYSSISVDVFHKSMPSPKLVVVNADVDGQFKNLDTDVGNQANIEVPLANVANFAALSGINLKIGATTVMPGDSWSGGDSADINDKFSILSDEGKALTWFDNGVSDAFFQMFVGTNAPQFGRVDTNVVPSTVLK